jgi:hypothetical protein
LVSKDRIGVYSTSQIKRTQGLLPLAGEWKQMVDAQGFEALFRSEIVIHG